ncbi:MAG: hypothetical protein E7340_00080 [Clostridiales bacterium]|nr:hypothetical protein [Clostridiales bacterium]
MEKLNNEQTAPTAQPTSVEKDGGATGGEVSLGKFKDVAALLSAYESLQSEFTKRCQRIKELESAASLADKENAPTKDGMSAPQKADITDEEKQNILKEYLQGVIDKKQKAVLLDGVGVGVKTPAARPKTISQAGMLAKQFLDK